MKHNKHLLILFSLLFFIVFISIAGVFGVSFFVVRKLNKKEVVDIKYSVVGSKELARNWIMVKAPTYKFDGSGLVFRGYRKLDCNFCYEFSFGFESRHAGYGNRLDDNLVSITTNHTTFVTLETGMIERVITDGEYDEMNGELVGEENATRATSTESQN